MRWALLLLVACGGGKDEGEGGQPAIEGLSFDDVQPIFESNCSPCHFGSATPSADLSLEHPSQFVGVLHAATGLDLVRPGSLEESYVWQKMVDTHLTLAGGSGGEMPPAGPIGDDDLNIVRSWILGGAEGDGGPVSEQDFCEDTHPGCELECEAGPGSVTHADWHNRLTESPDIRWDAVPEAIGYEVSIGTTAGDDDAHCWTDIGDVRAHTFRAIWVLKVGPNYVANVRAILPGDTRSEATSSLGWTVDIAPPEVPAALDDGKMPVNGKASWDHPIDDEGAGFATFEAAIGTSPGSDDAFRWTDVGAVLDTDLGAEVAELSGSAWYWLSLRAIDLAGNKSQSAISAGFITCPSNFSFVASDDNLESTPFCVATYEMRIEGNDNGSAGYDSAFMPDSRPTGTPWAALEKSEAQLACDAMGFSYQLISNTQWQAIARSIERTDGNWSGGEVGMGWVAQGHSDDNPANGLASDGDPCVGTGNANCTDPTSEDFSQRRTHDLDNGALVWDFAGNLTEHVDGSTGGPEADLDGNPSYWTSFDEDEFTAIEGWEGFREDFAPFGDYTEAQGMGMMYGGVKKLTRGGAYSSATTGRTGIFQAHHNSHETGPTYGFRCVFMPM